MKVGTIIEATDGTKIQIETIREFFITGREVDFKCEHKVICACTDFRIVSFENIKP